MRSIASLQRTAQVRLKLRSFLVSVQMSDNRKDVISSKYWSEGFREGVTITFGFSAAKSYDPCHAIGSTNFDDRAFEINDEITIGFLDASLARELEVIFERDLKDCAELQLESWSGRGVFYALKDHFFYLFNEQL